MKYADQEACDRANMFGMGQPDDAFESGWRNNWHRHDSTTGGGQVLICTAGEGWYQAEGKEPVELTEGSVVVPPNLK